MHDPGGHVAGAWVPTPSRPSCTQPGGVGGRDAPRAHPVPPHPAWPRARPLAPSVGRPCPAQVFASGQGWVALPRRACSKGGAPSSQRPLLVEMPGGICWINAPPGPRPHTGAGFRASPCSSPRLHPFPAEQTPPLALLPSPPDSQRSRGGQAWVPAKLQPCSGMGPSHLDGRAGSQDGDGDRSMGQEEPASPELPHPVTSSAQGGSKSSAQAGAPQAHPPCPSTAWDPAGLSHPAPYWEDAPRASPSQCPKAAPPHAIPPQLPQARRCNVVPCPLSHPEHKKPVRQLGEHPRRPTAQPAT